MSHEFEYSAVSKVYRNSDREQSHPQRPLENICFPIICQQRNRVYALLSLLRVPVFRRDSSYCHGKEIVTFSCLSRVCTHFNALLCKKFVRYYIYRKQNTIVFFALEKCIFFPISIYAVFDYEIFDNWQPRQLIAYFIRQAKNFFSKINDF